MVPHPVVFVLPDYAITRFAKYAPDFWAWKSGSFKFKTSQETRDFAVAKTIGSDRIFGSYLKPEKQERIDLLHRLLMEANPSGSDPESNRNASSQINILNELGMAYYSLSEYNRAIEFYQQALAISRNIGDRSGEASSLNNLGLAYGSLGEYQQVIQFYQQPLEIFRKIGDRNGEANSLMNLGNAYYSLGQHQQAIQFYQQSLEIKREIGDRHGEANSLNNLGIALKEIGRRKESIEASNASRKIFEELGLYHKIQGSDKSFAPLETVAKEPKRFIIKEEPKEPDWYEKSLPNYKPTARKRTQRKNLFQQILNWFRRLWSQLWRKY